MVNVAGQAEVLGTRLTVGDAVAAGRVQVAGLFLDISTARLLLLDPDAGCFVQSPTTICPAAWPYPARSATASSGAVKGAAKRAILWNQIRQPCGALPVGHRRVAVLGQGPAPQSGEGSGPSGVERSASRSSRRSRAAGPSSTGALVPR
jgi:hypothetical protein